MCLLLKKLTLWPKKVDTPTGDVDTPPKKVDSGGDGAESLLQPLKIAHFIEVLGVLGRKKSLFLGPILPDFSSFHVL